MLLFCSKTCCEICIIRVIRDSDTNFATSQLSDNYPEPFNCQKPFLWEGFVTPILAEN